MSQRIEEYSVGQLARLSGVSVRTLHHYDRIGLLKPAHVQVNGYRLYGRADLLRLQEILFYRSTAMPLAGIVALLDSAQPAVARLTRHRAAVAAKVAQATAVLATLDATITHLKGERDMANEDLYAAFTPAKQAEYEAWLIETYGPTMAGQIATARIAVGDQPEALAPLMAKLKDIEMRLVGAFEAGTGPKSPDNHAVLEVHRALMAKFWGTDCPPDAYAGLAEMYHSHPDFVARYERLSPRFSVWLPAAMQAHATRLRQGA
jgi:MerR family transcriptional regulator, thiopeptide resistance regulator